MLFSLSIPGRSDLLPPHFRYRRLRFEGVDDKDDKTPHR